jgi:hypothetical protein
MELVIRSHFSDSAVALLSHIASSNNLGFQRVHVIVIDTGWAAKEWFQRINQGITYAKLLGFEVVTIKPKISFPKLVENRKSFPNRKFQWCANFLKGLPLLDWLDEHDPECNFTVAIPKTQYKYSHIIPEYINECEYHGERKVIHPIKDFSESQVNILNSQAGFSNSPKSLECSPCVFSSSKELGSMHKDDVSKLKMLQVKLNKPMFNHLGLEFDKNIQQTRLQNQDSYQYAHGCALPFGCGL